jgi:hypothetical protein
MPVLAWIAEAVNAARQAGKMVCRSKAIGQMPWS